MRSFRFNNYILKISVVLLLAVVLCVIIVPFILQNSYNEIHLDDIWHNPSQKYILGSDNLGRDILTRLLYGGRISLSIALIVELIAFPIGTILGYISGIKSGLFIHILNKIMEVLFSFPTIILALTLSGILGVGTKSIIVSIAIAEIPVFFRYTKALVLKINNEAFIEVLNTLGIGSKGIFANHILVHLMPPLVPKIIFNFASTITFESTLSFIGLGIQPPMPSWGNMIRDGIPFIRSHPSLVVSSSVILAVTIMFLFGISDGLESKYNR